MKIILTFLGILFSVLLTAGPVKPDVTYTKIVKVVDMKSADEVLVTFEYSAIVWNENGANLSKLSVFYNQYVSVEDIEGALFDLAGNKLRNLINLIPELIPTG